MGQFTDCGGSRMRWPRRQIISICMLLQDANKAGRLRLVNGPYRQYR